MISDHGQCAETHTVRVNTVFRELGLLRLRRERTADPGGRGGPEGARASIRVPTSLIGLRRIPLLRRFVRGVNRELRGRLGIEVVTPLRGLDVDRTRSRVFSPTVASYAVYARDCSAAELRAVADALLKVRLDDGRPAFEDVWTPEELYGRPLPDGPSLVFAPSPGVRPSITVRQPVVENVAERGRGAHQRDGIILLGGPGTVARDLDRISIYDVAPTLLWAMEAAVPAGGERARRVRGLPRERRSLTRAPRDRCGPRRGTSHGWRGRHPRGRGAPEVTRLYLAGCPTPVPVERGHVGMGFRGQHRALRWRRPPFSVDLTGDHMVTYYRAMDEVFRALADPTRRSLLDELFSEDGQTLSALEQRLPMTRFGVMKHLRVLEEAGLVDDQAARPREAALPEPRPDPARPRPVGEQVRRALGRGAQRAQERESRRTHGEGVRDLHQDDAGAPVGGDHRPRDAAQVQLRRRRRARTGRPARATRPSTRRRTSPIARARTSRSTRRAGSSRASPRSGATT